MTRSRLLTVVFAFFILAGFAPIASAHYDPGTGRWLERDPSGLAQGIARRAQYGDGMNLYQYVRSSPGRFLDPSGLDAWEITGDPYKVRSDEEKANLVQSMKDCVVRKLKELKQAQDQYITDDASYQRTRQTDPNAKPPVKPEQYDCADSAMTMLVRCAAELQIALRLYAGGRWWSYRDYETIEDFEKALRRNLGAINLMDEQNSRKRKWEELGPGDLLLWDLRAHRSPSYKGHTAVTTARKENCDGDGKPCWEVIEGHLAGPLGTGTYGEDDAKNRWPNGPLWKEFGREWNWPDLLQ